MDDVSVTVLVEAVPELLTVPIDEFFSSDFSSAFAIDAATVVLFGDLTCVLVFDSSVIDGTNCGDPIGFNVDCCVFVSDIIESLPPYESESIYPKDERLTASS